MMTAAAGTIVAPTSRGGAALTLRNRNEAHAQPAGAAVLKRALQHVAEAQREQDRMMLRGALYDLAAVSIAWMDDLDAAGAKAA